MNNHQILALKQSEPTANTSDLEQQIERGAINRACTGLCEEEIAIVEGR